MASVHMGAAMRQIRLLFGEGTLAHLSDAHLLERYASRGDELAFEALVQRHGSMVLAVCRGVLDDSHDADDAFQATFLLLARKAGSLWVKDSVGGWLHRVAWRIASQARSDAGRRRHRERRSAEMSGPRIAPDRPYDDGHAVLHQEIDRLPDRYRKPLVLCYLEDMTYRQAAEHLCWSEGMVQSRLNRARNLLRGRLARRGVTLAVAALIAPARAGGASAVSMGLLLSGARAARHLGPGKTAVVGTASRAADALLRRALRGMFMAKLKVVAPVGLIVGAVTFAGTGRFVTGPIVAGESVAIASRTAPEDPRPRPAAGPSREPNWVRASRGRRFLSRPGAIGKKARATPRPTASEPWPERPTNVSRDLKPGMRLHRGDSLFSSLCGFRLRMGMDGDLMLCPIDDGQMPRDLRGVLAHDPRAMALYNIPIWTSGTGEGATDAGPGSYCEMGVDGNFVVYDEDARPRFSTGTQGHPGAFLRLQNDGNLVIYTPDEEVLWDSHTDAKPFE